MYIDTQEGMCIFMCLQVKGFTFHFLVPDPSTQCWCDGLRICEKNSFTLKELT